MAHFFIEAGWVCVAAGIVYLGLMALVWVLDWLVAITEGGE